jgi:hypothetical protein
MGKNVETVTDSPSHHAISMLCENINWLKKNRIKLTYFNVIL